MKVFDAHLNGPSMPYGKGVINVDIIGPAR